MKDKISKNWLDSKFEKKRFSRKTQSINTFICPKTSPWVLNIKQVNTPNKSQEGKKTFFHQKIKQ